LAPAAAEYGTEHSDVYAGVFYSTGRVYVGFTRDAEDHLAELRRHVDDPDGLRAFRADYTYAQIAETSARISADLDSLQRAGIPITGVGPDEYHNRVSVSLAKRNERHEIQLKERYGELLAFDARLYLNRPGLRGWFS
jgi:hypothetical protein